MLKIKHHGLLLIFALTALLWPSRVFADIEDILKYGAYIDLLKGEYNQCYLYDAEMPGENVIGFVLLEESGFQKSLLFNTKSGELIKGDLSIPKKEVREEIKNSSMKVEDIKLLIKLLAEKQRAEN